MKVGTKIAFKYTVNGHVSYLTGVLKEKLTNGNILVITEDKTEFELTPHEIH
jgi:hypothetical protein